VSKARDLANAGTALTTVSATELGYLDGVTSAVQTQIDSKIGAASAINPTIVDAKGDIVAATAADTVARLAVGANDTVLTADSTAATGLKWATPASGGMTLLSTTTLSGTSITLSSIPSTYRNLYIVIRNYLPATDNSSILLRFNGDAATRYAEVQASVSSSGNSFGASYYKVNTGTDNAVASGITTISIPDYANTTTWKFTVTDEVNPNPSSPTNLNYKRNVGIYNQTAAISSIGLGCENPSIGGFGSGSYTSGTVLLYGVN
jgi:hypothetical protein